MIDTSLKSGLTVVFKMSSKPSMDIHIESISTEDDLPSNLEAINITTKVVLFTSILAINLAMGCTLTTDDFRRQWKYPSGVIISMVSQFLTYPIVTFVLIHLLGIQSSYAVGIMLMVICPGSSASNIFTYLVDGDVCMSVCSTTFSTLLSFGMIPALMYVYTSSWTSSMPVVPYTTLGVVLLMIIGLVLLGMTLRAWKPNVASYIETIGTAIGLVCYYVCVLFYVIMQDHVFRSQWNVYFMSLVLPIAGFSIGYGTAYIFKQNLSRCRTIAIEIVFQNVGIAVLIMIATVDNFVWSAGAVFPVLYASASGIYGLVYMMVFKGYHDHPSKTMVGGYASLEPEDDFDNPWLLVDTDKSFRY